MEMSDTRKAQALLSERTETQDLMTFLTSVSAGLKPLKISLNATRWVPDEAMVNAARLGVVAHLRGRLAEIESRLGAMGVEIDA